MAEFDIPSGRAIRDHVPLLGKSPELEVSSEPFHVVLFAEHRGIPGFGGLGTGSASGVHVNVMCVVAASGDETYYENVDFTGLKP
jgi:hypothetical protein